MGQYDKIVEQLKASAVELAEEGLNFYECVALLNKAKAKNINGFVQFNGMKMYSLFDSEDDCYKRVYGKTKAEYDDYMKNLQKQVKRESEESVDSFKKALPELLEKGDKLIHYPQRKKEWREMLEFQGTLPYPALDAFEGCVGVLEKLEAGNNPDEVFGQIMTLSQVERENILQLVALYHKDGPALVKKYFPETKEFWGKRFEKIEAENATFQSQPGAPV